MRRTTAPGRLKLFGKGATATPVRYCSNANEEINLLKCRLTKTLLCQTGAIPGQRAVIPKPMTDKRFALVYRGGVDVRTL
jgi:hypothetical protein